MPAEMKLPLTFATFFICGVKNFTNLHQRVCVNLLLVGINLNDDSDRDSDKIVLSDADCSNYSRGKRALSREIQAALNKLSRDNVIERINKLKIQDTTAAANALRTLVENSSLSENEKRELLKCYQLEDSTTFMARVFLTSVMGKNESQILDQMQIDILKKYSNTYTSPDNLRGSVDRDTQDKSKFDLRVETENDESLDWMRDYVPASMINDPVIPTNRGVAVQYDRINLPEDYRRMVHILKPALKEANLKKFEMNEFIETMDIDAARHSLKEGQLEYWKFEGKIEYILELTRIIHTSRILTK